MKPFNLLCLLGICIFLSACFTVGPTYFGSSYPPTDSVESFYAVKDIGRPYKVIGHMVAAVSSSGSDHELKKSLFVARAKKAGANAIVFSNIIRQTHSDTLLDDFSIKAEVILYVKK